MKYIEVWVNQDNINLRCFGGPTFRVPADQASFLLAIFFMNLSWLWRWPDCSRIRWLPLLTLSSQKQRKKAKQYMETTSVYNWGIFLYSIVIRKHEAFRIGWVSKVKTKKLFFSATILIGNAESCSEECPSGWSEYTISGTSQCFKKAGLTRHSLAAAKCASLGGHLPLPLNKQQNDEMAAAFEEMGLAFVILNINKLNVNSDNQFLDIDGNLISYFNWNPGEPNDEPNKYVKMFPGNGVWVDTPGHYEYESTVCQQPKDNCCAADNIVLDCSPDQIELRVPSCFYDQQSVQSDTIFVGGKKEDSACHGSTDGSVAFSVSYKL